MKDYDKNKESSYLKYWDVNNSYGWTRSQKLPLSGFKWVENTCQYSEDFIKWYILFHEDSETGYFLSVDV